jgi:hypothetical protein
MSEAARALGADQVAQVFRALADEHCVKREALERELAWRCIASRARERARRRGGWLARLALPAAAALCLVCAALGWSYRPTLEYELVGAAAVVDGEIRAGVGGASLSFSDGSSVRASEQSVLSLSIVGQQAALTRLVRGALNVSVRHDERSDWRFLAGPYEIRVVGTKFDLSWDPEPALLHIAMHQGSVRVTGPSRFDRIVSAGESLERAGIENEAGRALLPRSEPLRVTETSRSEVLASSPVHARDTGAGPTPERALRAERAVPATSSPKPVRARAPSRERARPLPPEDDWPLLVSRGRFEEVVEAAARAGAEDVLARSDVSDLRALAQAARYTGNTPLALRAWAAVRDRFATHAAAQQAAFFVGRIYDEMDERMQARHWLDAYLAEASDGVYASEALGRRLSLSRRMDDMADAQHLAREYLDRFPTGAYVRTARALLSERSAGDVAARPLP